ncbi:MAG: protein kinase, partial [Candidatus Omnitrophica bacterium]|nr:protein kinase [Candidatus Omnitrophota bacterium]
YDPKAMDNANKQHFGDLVEFKDGAYGAIKGADLVIIATAWEEFRELDYARVKELMKEPNIFDGRNMLDPEEMARLGFRYASVGRKEVDGRAVETNGNGRSLGMTDGEIRSAISLKVAQLAVVIEDIAIKQKRLVEAIRSLSSSPNKALSEEASSIRGEIKISADESRGLMGEILYLEKARISRSLEKMDKVFKEESPAAHFNFAKGFAERGNEYKDVSNLQTLVENALNVIGKDFVSDVMPDKKAETESIMSELWAIREDLLNITALSGRSLGVETVTLTAGIAGGIATVAVLYIIYSKSRGYWLRPERLLVRKLKSGDTAKGLTVCYELAQKLALGEKIPPDIQEALSWAIANTNNPGLRVAANEILDKITAEQIKDEKSGRSLGGELVSRDSLLVSRKDTRHTTHDAGLPFSGRSLGARDELLKAIKDGNLDKVRQTIDERGSVIVTSENLRGLYPLLKWSKDGDHVTNAAAELAVGYFLDKDSSLANSENFEPLWDYASDNGPLGRWFTLRAAKEFIARNHKLAPLAYERFLPCLKDEYCAVRYVSLDAISYCLNTGYKPADPKEDARAVRDLIGDENKGVKFEAIRCFGKFVVAYPDLTTEEEDFDAVLRCYILSDEAINQAIEKAAEADNGLIRGTAVVLAELMDEIRIKRAEAKNSVFAEEYRNKSFRPLIIAIEEGEGDSVAVRQAIKDHPSVATSIFAVRNFRELFRYLGSGKDTEVFSAREAIEAFLERNRALATAEHFELAASCLTSGGEREAVWAALKVLVLLVKANNSLANRERLVSFVLPCLKHGSPLVRQGALDAVAAFVDADNSLAELPDLFNQVTACLDDEDVIENALYAVASLVRARPQTYVTFENVMKFLPFLVYKYKENNNVSYEIRDAASCLFDAFVETARKAVEDPFYPDAVNALFSYLKDGDDDAKCHVLRAIRKLVGFNPYFAQPQYFGYIPPLLKSEHEAVRFTALDTVWSFLRANDDLRIDQNREWKDTVLRAMSSFAAALKEGYKPEANLKSFITMDTRASTRGPFEDRGILLRLLFSITTAKDVLEVDTNCEMFRVIQAGMLVATVEEEFSLYFPGEKPEFFDGKLSTIAKVYRQFERNFVKLSRKYGEAAIGRDEATTLAEETCRKLDSVLKLKDSHIPESLLAELAEVNGRKDLLFSVEGADPFLDSDYPNESKNYLKETAEAVNRGELRLKDLSYPEKFEAACRVYGIELNAGSGRSPFDAAFGLTQDSSPLRGSSLGDSDMDVMDQIISEIENHRDYFKDRIIENVDKNPSVLTDENLRRIFPLLKSEDSSTGYTAAYAVMVFLNRGKHLASQANLEKFLPYTEDENQFTREFAIYAIASPKTASDVHTCFFLAGGELDSYGTLRELLPRLKDDVCSVRIRFLKALSVIISAEPSVAGLLSKFNLFGQVRDCFLSSYNQEERRCAMEALYKIVSEDSSLTTRDNLKFFTPYLQDKDDYIREVVSKILRKFDERGASLGDSAREVVEGSSGALYARGKFRELIESFDGDEVHVITMGGGGDVLGGTLLAAQIKELFRNRGKKPKICVFTSNLKRGRENPMGGPTPIDSIQGLRRLPNSEHLFDVTEKLKVKLDLTYEGKLLLINRWPISSKVNFSEGGIVRDLRKMGIDLIMVDVSRSGRDLASDYLRAFEGRKVLTIGIDMGGDVLAKFPSPINRWEVERHTERLVQSPNTDMVFLNMLVELEKEGKDVTMGISALGGDGELGGTLRDYLKELYDEGAIEGVWNNPAFARTYRPIFKEVDSLNVASETSRRFLEAVKRISKGKSPDYLRELSPWNPILTEGDPKHLPDHEIRGGTRDEIKPKLYPYSVFLSPQVVHERLINPTLRAESADWSWDEIDSYLRGEMHYATEMNAPGNILGRGEVILELVGEIFRKFRYSPENVFNTSINPENHELVRLAAGGVFLQRYPKALNAVKRAILLNALLSFVKSSTDAFVIASSVGLLGKIAIGESSALENELIETLRTLKRSEDRVFKWSMQPTFKGVDVREIQNAVRNALELIYEKREAVSRIALNSGRSLGTEGDSAKKGRLTGKLINKRYAGGAQIGQGSFGTVYLAQDQHLGGKTVVIKDLNPEAMKKPDVRARVAREVEIMGKLNSSNIVRVLERIPAPPAAPQLLVLDFAHGKPLSDWLPKPGEPRGPQHLSDQEAVLVAIDILKALEEMHTHGYVHRDIKPDNIMLDLDREAGRLHATILDLGLAKEVGTVGLEESIIQEGQPWTTQPHTIIGTPYYMSPEQTQGITRNLTAATDVYSMGMVLYQMLTGVVAVNPNSEPLPVLSVIVRHAKAEYCMPSAFNVSLDSELEEIIRKSLALAFAGQPDSYRIEVVQLASDGNALTRFKDATEFRLALESYYKKCYVEELAKSTVTMPPAKAVLVRKMPSVPIGKAVALAALLASVVGGIGWFMSGKKPAPAPQAQPPAPVKELTPAAPAVSAPTAQAPAAAPAMEPPVQAEAVPIFTAKKNDKGEFLPVNFELDQRYLKDKKGTSLEVRSFDKSEDKPPVTTPYYFRVVSAGDDKDSKASIRTSNSQLVDVPVTPGKKYALKLWVKRSSGQGAGTVFVRIAYKNSQGKFIDGDERVHFDKNNSISRIPPGKWVLLRFASIPSPGSESMNHSSISFSKGEWEVCGDGPGPTFGPVDATVETGRDDGPNYPQQAQPAPAQPVATAVPPAVTAAPAAPIAPAPAAPAADIMPAIKSEAKPLFEIDENGKPVNFILQDVEVRKFSPNEKLPTGELADKKDFYFFFNYVGGPARHYALINGKERPYAMILGGQMKVPAPKFKVTAYVQVLEETADYDRAKFPHQLSLDVAGLKRGAVTEGVALTPYKRWQKVQFAVATAGADDDEARFLWLRTPPGIKAKVYGMKIEPAIAGDETGIIQPKTQGALPVIHRPFAIAELLKQSIVNAVIARAQSPGSPKGAVTSVSDAAISGFLGVGINLQLTTYNLKLNSGRSLGELSPEEQKYVKKLKDAFVGVLGKNRNNIEKVSNAKFDSIFINIHCSLNDLPPVPDRATDQASLSGDIMTSEKIYGNKIVEYLKAYVLPQIGINPSQVIMTYKLGCMEIWLELNKNNVPSFLKAISPEMGLTVLVPKED